jgi:hypothetical protein
MQVTVSRRWARIYFISFFHEYVMGKERIFVLPRAFNLSHHLTVIHQLCYGKQVAHRRLVTNVFWPFIAIVGPT